MAKQQTHKPPEKAAPTAPQPAPAPAGKPAPQPQATAGGVEPRSATRVPSHEEIARRAYEIYLARGGEHGRSEEDWLQAERELKLGKH